MAKVDAITGKSDGPLDEDVMVALSVGCGAKEDDGLVVLEARRKGRNAPEKKKVRGWHAPRRRGHLPAGCWPWKQKGWRSSGRESS